jgi:hypothetical protein
MSREIEIECETLPLFDEPLPMDNPDALKKKKKQYQNIMSVQINRLMNHFKVDATPISKATGIPESTLHGWINFIVRTQDLDSNVKAVANYFGVSIDYFAFGTPVTDRDIELDDLCPEIDMPAGAQEIA